MLHINKNREGIYVDASEYSSEGRFYVEFLTTNGETMPAFDFVTFRMFSEDIKEMITLTFGKDALDKLVPMLEEVIRTYKDKREPTLVEN